MRSPWLVLVIAYALVRGLGCWAVGFYDDAFITYRYAANLAHGLGFVYNPGERVFGITTPLFGVLLGGLDRLGIPPPVAGRASCLLAESALLGLVFRRARKEGLALAGFATMGLALIDPYVTRITVGGMESPLFLLVSIAALVLAHDGRTGWALLLASGSIWLRPEGMVTLAVAGFYLFRWKKLPPIGFLLAALALLVLPAWLLQSYFGTVIPQSLQAKAKDVGAPLASVAAVFFAPSRDPLQTVLTLTALVSLPWAWRRSPTCRVVTAWAGLYAAAYLLARPAVWSWYALPIYFWKCMVTGFGAAILADRVNAETRVFRPASVLAVAAPVFLWGAVAWKLGEAPARRHIFRPISAFIRTEMSTADSVYAHDVGVVGYYSGACVLDHFGLVWKDLDRFEDWQHVLKELRPKWAMIVTPIQYRAYLEDAELAATYAPRARFTETGDTAIAPDTTRLGREWAWDYMILERVARSRDGAASR